MRSVKASLLKRFLFYVAGTWPREWLGWVVVVELTEAWGNEEVRIFLCCFFFRNTGRVLFFSFSQVLRLEAGPECFLLREVQRGSTKLFISVFSFGCFSAFLSLSFTHWETCRKGVLAWVWWSEIQLWGALLLAPNMFILNNHLGDLCKLAFS